MQRLLFLSCVLLAACSPGPTPAASSPAPVAHTLGTPQVTLPLGDGVANQCGE